MVRVQTEGDTVVKSQYVQVSDKEQRVADMEAEHKARFEGQQSKVMFPHAIVNVAKACTRSLMQLQTWCGDHLHSGRGGSPLRNLQG